MSRRRIALARPNRMWAIVAAVLLGALVVELSYDWGGFVSTADKKRESADDASRATAQDEAVRQPPDFGAYLDAPLFVPSRQAIALPSTNSGEPQNAETAALELLGTVVSENGRIAIIRATEGREVFRLRGGETVAGWTVLSIEPRDVRIERSGTIVILTLDESENGSGRQRPALNRPQRRVETKGSGDNE